MTQAFRIPEEDRLCLTLFNLKLFEIVETQAVDS